MFVLQQNSYQPVNTAAAAACTRTCCIVASLFHVHTEAVLYERVMDPPSSSAVQLDADGQRMLFDRHVRRLQQCAQPRAV